MRIPLRALLLSFAALVLTAPAAHAVAPTAGGVPSITGTTRVGQVLNSTNGSFTGTAPITYTRRWVRCDEDGANCATITGATGSSYTLQSDDANVTVRVVVTASNIDGSATATSAPTAVIAPKAPPVNSVLPVITGTPKD